MYTHTFVHPHILYTCKPIYVVHLYNYVFVHLDTRTPLYIFTLVHPLPIHPYLCTPIHPYMYCIHLYTHTLVHLFMCTPNQHLYICTVVHPFTPIHLYTYILYTYTPVHPYICTPIHLCT